MRRLTIFGALAAVSGCTFFSSSNVCGFGGTCNTYLDGGRDAGGGDGGSPPADAGLDAGDAGGDAGVTDAGQDAGQDAGPEDAGPVCPTDAGPTPAPLQIGPAAASCSTDASPTQIIYVDSSAGNDANDGGLGFALQTIGGAISLAADAGFTTPAEIHVCAGTYTENVVLGIPISLKGGYDCATGARPQICFNPALADSGVPYFGPGSPAATTTITGVPGSAATLTLDGRAQDLPQGVSVDGFSIFGPSNPGTSTGSQALVIQGEVQAEISNNYIVGGAAEGSGQPGNIASIGVLLDNDVDGGAPPIDHNFISGGAASTSENSYGGSAGIYILGGAAAFVHDNRIEGGNSSADATFNINGESVTTGIFTLDANPLTLAAGTPIEFNSIYGGRGSSDSALEVQITAGIVVSWEASHPFDVIGNIIEGGDVPTGSTATGFGPKGAVGISSRVGGNCCPNQNCTCHPEFQIVGNKIYGGDSLIGAPTMALYLSAYAAKFSIANNMIHAGGARQVNTGTRTAIDFAQASIATVAGNTIYAGGVSGGEGVAVTLETDPGYVHQISMSGNILAGNSTNALGLQFLYDAGPGTGIIPQLQDNLFLSQDIGAAECNGAFCWPDTSTPPLEELSADLFGQNPAGSYTGNLVYRSACSEAGCITRPNICDGTTAGTLDCLQDVFVSWDGQTSGLKDLYDGGWTLNPAPTTSPDLPQCAVTTGTQPPADAFPWTQDIFGVNRALAGTSMGAAVLNACCL